MVKTVVGSFDSIAQAAGAARALRAAGFMENDVSVVANNAQRAVAREGDATTGEAASDDKASGAAKGIVAGGALGGVAGLAASLMGLAIPGIGPILAAGPVAAALAGAGAGAVAGGLIGSLTDLGVSDTHAEYYAEAVRRGGALVTVKVDQSRVQEAEQIIKAHDAFDIEARASQWMAAGWVGYNPNGEPYTFEEIERNRTRWTAAQRPRSARS
ncbi:MAG TPA: general stress protein [Casimicrobiaceae bacterium]|nr:general stress protein [Casimicrobiaceae bacterium]